MTSKVPTDSKPITHEPHTPEYLEKTKPVTIPGAIHNVTGKRSLRKGK